jgi:hypothetical protein
MSHKVQKTIQSDLLKRFSSTIHRNQLNSFTASSRDRCNGPSLRFCEWCNEVRPKLDTNLLIPSDTLCCWFVADWKGARSAWGDWAVRVIENFHPFPDGSWRAIYLDGSSPGEENGLTNIRIHCTGDLQIFLGRYRQIQFKSFQISIRPSERNRVSRGKMVGIRRQFGTNFLMERSIDWLDFLVIGPKDFRFQLKNTLLSTRFSKLFLSVLPDSLEILTKFDPGNCDGKSRWF